MLHFTEDENLINRISGLLKDDFFVFNSYVVETKVREGTSELAIEEQEASFIVLINLLELFVSVDPL